MTVNDNPCLACPGICRYLKGEYGLRLSKDEFEAYFRDREQNLHVRVEDKIVILSSGEGLVCPYLGGLREQEDRRPNLLEHVPAVIAQPMRGIICEACRRLGTAL